MEFFHSLIFQMNMWYFKRVLNIVKRVLVLAKEVVLFFVRKNDEVELICRYGNLLLLLVDGTVHGNGDIATIFTELPQAVTNVYILFISLFGSNTSRINHAISVFVNSIH